MDLIFHEKQQGSLCAQHCLNTLLQGEYFTPVDLGSIARSLDEEENSRMAEVGTDTEEYKKFAMQPSGNVDDSGYFSVQVLSSALEIWGLEMLPIISSDKRAEFARKHPCTQKAYICNYKDHWFTIRRIGKQWFNLNSLLSGPEVISDTYLDIFLAQLREEGYSIFVILGEFPNCDADIVLSSHPVSITASKSKSDSQSKTQASSSRQVETINISDDDADLQAAIQLSLVAHSNSGKSLNQKNSFIKPSDLQDAINVNLDGGKVHSLQLQNVCSDEKLLQNNPACGEIDENDEDLKAAIELSMKGHVDNKTVSQEELRNKRSKFLMSIGSSSDQNS